MLTENDCAPLLVAVLFPRFLAGIIMSLGQDEVGKFIIAFLGIGYLNDEQFWHLGTIAVVIHYNSDFI